VHFVQRTGSESPNLPIIVSASDIEDSRLLNCGAMKPHRLAPCIAATRRAWWKVIKGGRKWAGLARKRQCAAKPRYRGPSCIRYPVKAGRRTRLLPSVANANALGLKDNIYLAALMQWRIK